MERFAQVIVGAEAEAGHLTIAVSTAAVGATHCPQDLTCSVDTTELSLTGVQFGQAVVAILAVLTISNEYSSGMIRTTLAAIVRDSAVSIGVVLALLYVFPIVLSFVGNAHWQHRLERWTPTIAGLAIQATTGLRSLAISPWGGLGVLGIWAAAALVLGVLTLRLRDA